MSKFTTFEQVEREFKNKSNGSNILQTSKVRYSDLSEHKEDIEYLLATDYNKLSGMTFSEIMEGVSTAIYNNADEYINDNRANRGILNESFITTTQAQTQFPVLNKGLVFYQYEKSVLPYLAHVFDLKANRGLAYYMELIAQNAQGDVVKGDIIASPKTLSKQTTNFITTKEVNKQVATLVQGQASYTIYLGGAQVTPISIQPQSLTITVDGVSGHLQDVSNDKNGEAVYLLNVDGKVGEATVNLNTGEITLVLAVAPAVGGGKIRATYNRDVQTTLGGSTNQAIVAPQLTSVQLEAEDFSVFTETNLHQQRLAQVIFGMDWNAEVDKLLGQCYNKEIANKVFKDIANQIPQGSVSTYDIAGNMGADNRFFNLATLPVPFHNIPKNISKASGLGINKVSCYVANIDFMPILQHTPKFKSIETEEEYMGGMALVGTYDGVPVLQTYEPILAGSGSGSSAEVVGIYKSKKQEFLTAAVVGQFILPVIRDIFDQNNLAVNKKQLIASAATKTVVPQLAAKLIVPGISTVFGT